MSKVLLPIKPQYAYPILMGCKNWELRRKIWKRPGIKTVVVYATAPVSKVIGWFEIFEIRHDTLFSLYRNCHHDVGTLLKWKEFAKYFEGCEKGYAIGTIKRYLYKQPLDLIDLGIDFIPQGFIYLPIKRRISCNSK